MGRALALRQDYDAAGLRALARTTKHAGQARRLLALAAIYDGASREDVVRLAGTDRQIVRGWVIRFDIEGPEGVREHHGCGIVPRLTPSMLEALMRGIEDGLIASVHGTSSSISHGASCLSGYANGLMGFSKQELVLAIVTGRCIAVILTLLVHVMCFVIAREPSLEQTNFTCRVDVDLKQAFLRAAKANDRPASVLIRDFMRDYVQMFVQRQQNSLPFE